MRPPVSPRRESTYRPIPPDPSPLGMVLVMAGIPLAMVAASYPLATAALALVVLAAVAAYAVFERATAARTNSRGRRLCVPGTDVCVTV